MGTKIKLFEGSQYIMYCKDCGSLVQEGDFFCRNCGKPLNVEKENRVCPQCGNEIREGNVYCVTCGYKVDDAIEDTVSDIPQTENVEKKPRTKNKKRNIVTVGCVLVLGVAFLVWAYVFVGVRFSGKETIKTTNQTYTDENSISKADEKLVKEIGYNSDGSIFYEYEYDSQGNVIKSVIYNSDGSIDETGCEYEYDSQGNVIKEIIYNSDGSIDETGCEYEYDSQGNVIKKIGYNSDGSIDYELDCEYEYDSQGNMIKLVIYNSDGSINYWKEYFYE
jgi:YD repeat-containing protein